MISGLPARGAGPRHSSKRLPHPPPAPVLQAQNQRPAPPRLQLDRIGFDDVPPAGVEHLRRELAAKHHRVDLVVVQRAAPIEGSSRRRTTRPRSPPSSPAESGHAFVNLHAALEQRDRVRAAGMTGERRIRVAWSKPRDIRPAVRGFEEGLARPCRRGSFPRARCAARRARAGAAAAQARATRNTTGIQRASAAAKGRRQKTRCATTTARGTAINGVHRRPNAITRSSQTIGRAASRAQIAHSARRNTIRRWSNAFRAASRVSSRCQYMRDRR